MRVEVGSNCILKFHDDVPMQFFFNVSKIGLVFYMQVCVQVREIYLVKGKSIFGELQNV